MGARSHSAEAPPADGFTIIEVLVAITVLVIAMLGAALLFENAIVASGNTRNRIVAANLATEQMESVRGKAADPAQWANIPFGGSTYADPVVQKVNGIQFTVEQDVAFVGQNSTTNSCDNPSPGGISGQIVRVSETVTWPDMGGTQPIYDVTTLSPPVGTYSQLSGAIAAKVFDSTGAVAPSISVQVSGPTATPNQQTTTDGCVYFVGLAPGTYRVTIVEGTGVDDQEVVAPVQTTSVAVGQTRSLQFQYDDWGTIVATLPSPTNPLGAPAHASGMSISVANTGLQPYSQFSFTAAAGDVTTSPNLYPYTSGYTVFAGNCTDNNPLGKDTSRNLFYPTATATQLNVPANGSAPATVSLYALAAHVQTSAVPAVAVANATVTATETSFPTPYAALCTSGTATAGTLPTITLTVSNATGDSVTSMPLGHWTIKVTSGSKSGTVNVWVKPDGVYAVNSSGVATTKFAGPITVVVS